VACHQANGKGMPGAFPALDGSKIATGDQGRPHRHRPARQAEGTAMAAYGKPA
jgi:cytochrome c oxidase subunit 2